jgi:hypothetical protein
MAGPPGGCMRIRAIAPPNARPAGEPVDARRPAVRVSNLDPRRRGGGIGRITAA